MRLAIAALLLAFGATAAHAEDWSSFIDPNPSKPIASKPVVVADAAKPTKPAHAAKATSKAKPKAKTKARTKARRK